MISFSNLTKPTLLVFCLWLLKAPTGLIAGPPPTITKQPASLTVKVGQNAFFTVVATDSAPISYQWRSNRVDVAGATNDTLSLGVAHPQQTVTFTVVVSGTGGSVTSAPPAVLTVNAAAPGTVAAWGANDTGQTNVPATAQSQVVAVAAGYGHTVALKNDGAVVAWGSSDYGQTNVPNAAQSGVVAIAAGYAHTLGFRNDGSLEPVMDIWQRGNGA